MTAQITSTSTTTTLKNNGNTYMSVDTNDIVALTNPLPVASGGTGGTSAVGIQLQTAVATTSGTTIDFTGIPAGVKKIIIAYVGVSTDGNSMHLVQLGDSGGLETSGYVGSVLSVGGSTAAEASRTDAFQIVYTSSADRADGMLILALADASTNTWVSQGAFEGSNVWRHAGSKSLSGVLTQVGCKTLNGEDYDAGKASISWEF